MNFRPGHPGDLTGAADEHQDQTQCQPHRTRHWRQHQERFHLVVGQRPGPRRFLAALAQPAARVGFDQIGIDGEAENRTDQRLHPISDDRRASGDDILDQTDDVGALNAGEVPIGPVRQNVKAQIALVGAGRALEAPGVLDKVPLGETGEAPLGSVPLVCRWILPGGDLTAQRIGLDPSIAQAQARVTAQ